MSHVDIRVELLLDTTLIEEGFFTLDVSVLDGPDVLAPTLDWVDVTSDVMSFSTNRGRPKDIDQFQSGTAVVRFLNNDRKYDPTNTDSIYSGNIIPMRQIRIFGVVDIETYTGLFYYRGYPGPDDDVEKIQTRLTELGFDTLGIDGIFGTNTENAVIAFQTDKEILIDGIVGPQTWEYIFNRFQFYRGYVENWRPYYHDKGIWSTTEAMCGDGFIILANQELDEISASHNGDTSGERITRVLNLSEVDYPSTLRDIDTGNTTFGATTFGENALAYLQTCERSESGSLFVSKEGKLTFVARNATGITTDIIFTDVNTDLDNRIAYEEIEPDYSTEFLYNRIIVAGTTGNEQTASDTDSQEKYQIRTLKRTDLFMQQDSFAQDMANFFLGRFSEPDFRFKSISLNLEGLTSDQKKKQILELELSHRLTVEKTPPGTGTPTTIQQSGVVDGLAYSWQPGNVLNVNISVSTGRNLAAFILDDEVLGVLDENILGL